MFASLFLTSPSLSPHYTLTHFRHLAQEGPTALVQGYEGPGVVPGYTAEVAPHSKVLPVNASCAENAVSLKLQSYPLLRA